MSERNGLYTIGTRSIIDIWMDVSNNNGGIVIRPYEDEDSMPLNHMMARLDPTKVRRDRSYLPSKDDRKGHLSIGRMEEAGDLAKKLTGQEGINTEQEVETSAGKRYYFSFFEEDRKKVYQIVREIS